MKIVIGSGPAGVACAQALLDQGEKVQIIDAGIQVEPRQQELISKIQSGDADALSELKRLQFDVPLSDKGVALKLAYGSDFCYRDVGEHLGFEGLETGLGPSLGLGGFSNVWGSAVLPYLQRDIEDWPITIQDLSRHYEAALQITGLAAKRDDLSSLFPLYREKLNDLQPSSQARWLLEGLDRSKSALNQDGITYGSSRLAVGPNASQGKDCIYCGQCLYGCPYGVIYNSAYDISRFSREMGQAFSYRPNIIVEKIMEANGAARVSGYDRLTWAPVEMEAERVFLGAGVISSSKIALKSLDAYGQPRHVSDSQYFILPVLSVRGDGKVPREALHTLSQLFVEIQDENISPYTIHLQLYTYNDILGKVMLNKLWFAPGLRELAVHLFQHRFIIIQGYLHSIHSGTMKLTLTRDSKTGRDRLVVEGQRNPETRKKINQIIDKLSKHFTKLGLFSVTPMLDVTLPGRGYHSGGSFPMKSQPINLETDRFGRLAALPHLHLVDASVFPSIPATTITLTAMANAHRIGSTWKEATP